MEVQLKNKIGKNECANMRSSLEIAFENASPIIYSHENRHAIWCIFYIGGYTLKTFVIVGYRNSAKSPFYGALMTVLQLFIHIQRDTTKLNLKSFI